MDAFKFDTILSSLHDLQQVKSTNEMKLEEERSKRRQLESKIAKAATELQSLSSRHSELLEAEQINEQKMSQLEKQINRLECLNQDKSCKIAKLNEEITLEQETQQNDLLQFESAITELTDRFRTAPKIYADENIDTSIEQYEKDICELKLVVSELDKKLQDLSERGVPETDHTSQEDLNEEQLHLVHDMFAVENEASERKKQEMKEKYGQLNRESDILENEIHKLQTELQEYNNE